MDAINKYFELNELQQGQFKRLTTLYIEWNEKINLISRKDIDNLEVHHLLHSLAIFKFFKFKSGAEILDLGCGGGFPGIMLALMMPEVNFTLIDGKKKKIMVVNEIIKDLKLKNVTAIHGRAEEIKNQRFDFVVTRAVATIDKLRNWCQNLIRKDQFHAWPNGIIALKGGDIKKEIKLLNKKDYHELYKISEVFSEDFFEEKYVLYLQD